MGGPQLKPQCHMVLTTVIRPEYHHSTINKTNGFWSSGLKTDHNNINSNGSWNNNNNDDIGNSNFTKRRNIGKLAFLQFHDDHSFKKLIWKEGPASKSFCPKLWKGTKQVSNLSFTLTISYYQVSKISLHGGRNAICNSIILHERKSTVTFSDKFQV